jgi:uncharacterized protein (DUF1778 family)
MYCKLQYNAGMKTDEKSTVLQTRLTPEQKAVIQEAAELRRLSLSDYVRQLLVTMARQDVESAKQNVIELTAEGQLAFWKALNAPVKLTPAQKRLGRVMRGEA